MFYKIQIETWSEAISANDLLHSISPIWIFRGQSNADWPLATTFEREAKKHNLDRYYYKTCESNILTDFKRQAGQHIKNYPPEDSLIDWLAYIQHYGGPTRLLDFSYSFYVAAFFSMQQSGNSPSIWSINVNQLISHNEKYKSLLFDVGYRETLNKYGVEANENIMAPQKFTSNHTSGCILLVEPYNQEQRLAIQQGLFLFPTKLEETFETNLCGSLSDPGNCFKQENIKVIKVNDLSGLSSDKLICTQIVFKPSIVYEAINKLKSMNISNATLFPGLDGFARSLDFHFYDMNWSFIKPRKNNT